MHDFDFFRQRWELNRIMDSSAPEQAHYSAASDIPRRCFAEAIIPLNRG